LEVHQNRMEPGGHHRRLDLLQKIWGVVEFLLPYAKIVKK
jgi:hypothetical protein